MDRFKVSATGGLTIVEDFINNFKFRVLDSKAVKLSGNTAVIEATLYIEQVSFIPTKSYLFELINDDGEPIDLEVDIEHFKTAIDFFFNSVLGTDLFVKSIPRASTLCPIERKEYQF